MLLFSGGLDSFLGAWELREAATLLFIRTGVPYEEDDLIQAELLAELCGMRLHVMAGAIDFSDITNPMIRNRNMLLLSLASQLNQHVMMCSVHEDFTPDGSKAFYRAAAHALGLGLGSKVYITNPLNWRSKPDAVARYLRCGGPISALLYTRSCYAPGTQHCGACPACAKRFIAFRANGIIGDTYQRDPREFIQEMRSHGTAADALRLGPKYLLQVRDALR